MSVRSTISTCQLFALCLYRAGRYRKASFSGMRSKVPLHKWLYAMYLVVTAPQGISTLQLAKEIGITEQTAWFILRRLREACSDPATVGKRLSYANLIAGGRAQEKKTGEF